MRLYHRPGSRSSRVLWLLEELELPYELTEVSHADADGDGSRRGHPLGRIPVLEYDDGRFVFESAAICLHLAEGRLMPPPGSYERALVYQWVLFGMTEVEPKVAEAYRTAVTDPERSAAGEGKAGRGPERGRSRAHRPRLPDRRVHRGRPGARLARRNSPGVRPRLTGAWRLSLGRPRRSSSVQDPNRRRRGRRQGATSIWKRTLRLRVRGAGSRAGSREQT